jgi:ABC-type multidrug transport system fused ATPase/permease subunit
LKQKQSLFSKVLFLLNKQQKKQIIILAILLIMGMFFEMGGVGILFPAVSVIVNPNPGKDYPILKPYLHLIDHISHTNIVIIGMLLLVIFYLVKAFFLIYLTWRQSKLSSDLSADLSKKLFNGYLYQKYEFHLTNNSAELLRNIQIEVGVFLNSSQAFIAIAIELSALIGIAFILFYLEPIGALVITIFLFLSVLIFQKISKKTLLNWGQKRQYYDGQTNKHLIQGLNGVKDVKILGRENSFLNKFNVYNLEKANMSTKQNTLLMIPRFYLELLAVMGLAGLIVMMTIQNKTYEQVLPAIGIFVAAAFRMIPSVNRIMSALVNIRSAEPVVNLLYNELSSFDANAIVQDLEKSKFELEEIEVNKLSFHYKGAKDLAVNNINFNIKRGMSVGFIGTSGSGKSTLIDLLLGLLDCNSGEIKINGFDIKEIKRSWQNIIGYVPQSIYLTDDSLKNNIAFGLTDEEINEKQLRQAIQAAQLDEFVNSLPEGLNTYVGERGVRLSGGQRQRIGIARALYHNPQVLVLDEATSALDSKTEQGVIDAVNILKGNKTLIIVAHRLSTINSCDILYRLENGVIVQQGKPILIL